MYTNLNEIEEKPKLKINLKVVVQISSGKLLYAEAGEDFVEFLFSLLFVPLGDVEKLVAGKTCVKAVDNLYRSVVDLIYDKYLKSSDTKERLMKPNVFHGCISDNHILPLTQQSLHAGYSDNFKFCFSDKFPKGRGRYLNGPTTYVVMDDLTVTPFCISWIISSLKERNIPTSDVKQVELQIGTKEGLSILKASLTSTSALSDALLNHIPIKQPKTEV